MVGRCGLDASGLGYGSIIGSYEHGNGFFHKEEGIS